jgi:hypothetical protein
MSRMSTNIFHNPRKHNRDTCKTNDKAFDPPNKYPHKMYLQHPSHNYTTFSSRPTTPITPSTQIKPVSSHTYPAKAISIK